MKNRIAVVGCKQGLPKPQEKSLSWKMDISGGNFGNFLIGYAIHKQISHCEFVDINSPQLDLKWLNECFDAVVVASSNFIRSNSNMDSWSKIFEKIDLPTIPIGLGAQSMSCDVNMSIPESTKRWLSIVSEKATSIGVRGNFTAELLSNHGINNVQVIGCPSAFLSLFRDFNFNKKRVLERGSTVIVHGNPRPGQFFFIDNLINKYQENYRTYYLAQSELKLLQWLYDELEEKELGNFMQIQSSSEERKQFLRDKTLYFSNVENWISYMKEHVDFSVGGRFHGNMVALQAGVPALWITHDSRTREFCDFFQFPSLDFREVSKYSATAMYDQANFDEFNKIYPKRYDNYQCFLEENNLPHSLGEQKEVQKEIVTYNQLVSLKASQENKATQKERVTAQQYFKKGNELRKNGELDAAVKKYKKALDFHVNFVPALNQLAATYWQKKEFRKATNCYQSLLEKKPNDANNYVKLGRTLLKQEDHPAAIMAFRTALELDPEQPSTIYRDLGNALNQSPPIEEVITCYQKAIELDPNQPPIIYKKLGDALQKQKQHQKAIEAYQKAIESNPNNPAFYNALGSACIEAGQFANAITAYQKFVELKSENPIAYKKLGNALEKKGRLNEAKTAYTKAQQLEIEVEKE